MSKLTNLVSAAVAASLLCGAAAADTVTVEGQAATLEAPGCSATAQIEVGTPRPIFVSYDTCVEQTAEIWNTLLCLVMASDPNWASISEKLNCPTF
jgi:hypothetical protein